MKNLILALAIVLMPLPSGCDEPQPAPFETGTSLVEIEPAKMDSLQYAMRQDLEATREKIDKAWRKQDGYYICYTSTNMCWNAILIYNAQAELEVRFYTQWLGCPAPGNTDTTCHEGNGLPVRPIGRCTDRDYWLDLADLFIDAAWPVGSYKAGDSYTGWYRYEVTPFGPSDLQLVWDYQDPSGPRMDCPVPPYLPPEPPARRASRSIGLRR